jgi:tetratricopeptide (TPR) repeat protein
MKPLARLALLLLAVFALLPAAAATGPWQGDSMIDDPEWRKSFLGSYGFLSGAEPQIAPDEVAVLREVIDLLKVNPRAAAALLEQKAGSNSSAALDFVLANLQFQDGKLDEAKARYQTALEKFPDFRRAHKNLGLLLVQEGSYPEALEHLSRAAELGDRDGRTFGLMGYCYVNQENYVAAEEAYRQAILQEPETRDWKLGLARSLMAMEQYREAVALLSTLLESDPENATLWLLQANAYVGLEKPRAAAVNLEAVRMMGKAQSRSLVLLGDIYMNAGMYDLAKDAYLEVIESDEQGARFQTAYRAAQLLVRTRAFDQAKGILRSIEARYGKELSNDDELKVLTLQAKVERAQGREKEAAKLLESIVERDGTRGDALLELAAYYESQGDNARAMLLLERAQRLEAFAYPALLEQAQLLVSERRYGEAAELLHQALEIKREPRVVAFLSHVEEAARR